MGHQLQGPFLGSVHILASSSAQKTMIKSQEPVKSQPSCSTVCSTRDVRRVGNMAFEFRTVCFTENQFRYFIATLFSFVSSYFSSYFVSHKHHEMYMKLVILLTDSVI